MYKIIYLQLDELIKLAKLSTAIDMVLLKFIDGSIMTMSHKYSTLTAGVKFNEQKKDDDQYHQDREHSPKGETAILPANPPTTS